MKNDAAWTEMFTATADLLNAAEVVLFHRDSLIVSGIIMDDALDDLQDAVNNFREAMQ